MREQATGAVFVKVGVSSPAEDSPAEELDFPVDTGAKPSFLAEGDATVLGVTTLEGLGLYVDPVRRRMKELLLLL